MGFLLLLFYQVKAACQGSGDQWSCSEAVWIKGGRGSTKATWGQDGLPFESFRFFSPGLRERLADQFELDAVCFMSNQVRWNIRIFGCSQKFCLWWNVLASSIGHELWFLCLQSPSECHREVISQHQIQSQNFIPIAWSPPACKRNRCKQKRNEA